MPTSLIFKPIRNPHIPASAQGRRPYSSFYAYRTAVDKTFDLVPTLVIAHRCLIIEFCFKVLYCCNSLYLVTFNISCSYSPLASAILLYMRVGVATICCKDIESKFRESQPRTEGSLGFPIVLIALMKTLSALSKLSEGQATLGKKLAEDCHRSLV